MTVTVKGPEHAGRRYLVLRVFRSRDTHSDWVTLCDRDQSTPSIFSVPIEDVIGDRPSTVN